MITPEIMFKKFETWFSIMGIDREQFETMAEVYLYLKLRQMLNSKCEAFEERKRRE